MHPLIESLQTERAGYVARGLTGRVAQVDAEIRRLAADTPEPAPIETTEAAPDRQVETAARVKPRTSARGK